LKKITPEPLISGGDLIFILNLIFSFFLFYIENNNIIISKFNKNINNKISSIRNQGVGGIQNNHASKA
jgi:hypothetical protein